MSSNAASAGSPDGLSALDSAMFVRGGPDDLRENDDEFSGRDRDDEPPPPPPPSDSVEDTLWMDHGCVISTGSMSGGYTTITNLADGALAGGAGDQDCSPSRSTFEFVGALAAADGDSLARSKASTAGLGSFASYYRMQRDGPFIPDTRIRQDELLKHQDDDTCCARSQDRGLALRGAAASGDHDEEEGGGFCDDAECGNVESSDLSTEGKGSSLSSITNDFFYPKFSETGKFTSFGYGKKPSRSTTKNSTSPQSSGEKSIVPKTGSSPLSTPKRMRSNLISGSPRSPPWFNISTNANVSMLQLQPFHQSSSPPGKHLAEHKEQQQSTPPRKLIVEQHRQLQLLVQDEHPDPKVEHVPPDLAAVAPPREVLIEHHPHHDGRHSFFGEVLSFPSPCDSPSVISSSNLSQLFTSELRERYRRSIYRSYGRRYRQVVAASRSRKTLIVVCLSIALLVGGVIVATVLIVGGQSAVSSTGAGEGGEGGATIKSDYDVMSLPSRGDGLPSACCVDGYHNLDGAPEPETEPIDRYDGGEPDEVEEVASGPGSNGVDAPATPSTSSPLSSSSSTSMGGTTATPSVSSELHVDLALSHVGGTPTTSAHSASTREPSRQPTPSPTTVIQALESLDFGSVTVATPHQPTSEPSRRATQPTALPTRVYTMQHTGKPTRASVSDAARPVPTPPPSRSPSRNPSRHPSRRPSRQPSPRPTTRKPSKPPTRPPTSPPTIILPPPKPAPVDPSSSMVVIKSIDTVISESQPDRNYGGESVLSIKGNTKVALLKFDVSPLNGYSFKKAYLVLNSVPSAVGDGVKANVRVDLLPSAGNWNEHSITWRNNVRLGGSLRAGSFSVGSWQKSRKHEIDVTDAFLNSFASDALIQVRSSGVSGYATFEVYVESGDEVDLASRELDDGSLEPELRVLFSDSPTISPTQIPSSSPSQPPPTMSPSASPARPTKSPSQAPTTMEPSMRPQSESPTSSPNAPSSSPTTLNPTFRQETPTPSAPPVSLSAPPSASPTAAPTRPLTEAPTTPEPTQEPTPSAPPSSSPTPPVASTTTSTTTSSTSSFPQCPNEYSTSESYTSGVSLVSYNPPSSSGSYRLVYKCTGSSCNEDVNAPGTLNAHLTWTLVGTCTAPATLPPTAATPPPTTPKPSSRSPTRAPTKMPTHLPTGALTLPPLTPPPTLEPTLKPTPPPSKEQTPPPTSLQPATTSPTPNPTPNPVTATPTTASPTTASPSRKPTLKPITPDPTTAPPSKKPTPLPTALTPNPTTKEPTPGPSPEPSKKPSPAPETPEPATPEPTTPEQLRRRRAT